MRVELQIKDMNYCSKWYFIKNGWLYAKGKLDTPIKEVSDFDVTIRKY